MSKDVPFTCSCGAVRGVLRDIRPRSGGHLRCYCADCRQAAVWAGDVTPTPNGIHYYQTTPDRIDFATGLASLRVFKWKKGRLLRWYAPCCGSPMFNTLDSPKWAFASINTERFSTPDALGPAVAFAFKPMPNGKSKTKGFVGFIAGFARRTIWARISGAWRNTPFFDATGETITSIKQLTAQERARVRQT
ncbi:DUF6151 family protein [Octadecabacter sp. 1_MG-2023]|uniref:DUF6151 family protein n=1 Tax=unclassified Octadecabacter TaxID=196158 RepID=UPI0025B2591A|nr:MULTISPECIES: DUF6151 family protein [unclassified Octadecabacter]MDO6733718.1 DUF6151 family protein [Octadecabacter sp. 1_MG-2023]